MNPLASLIPSPSLSPLPPSLQPRRRVRRLKQSISIRASPPYHRRNPSSNTDSHNHRHQIQRPPRAQVVKNLEAVMRSPGLGFDEGPPRPLFAKRDGLGTPTFGNAPTVPNGGDDFGGLIGGQSRGLPGFGGGTSTIVGLAPPSEAIPAPVGLATTTTPGLFSSPLPAQLPTSIPALPPTTVPAFPTTLPPTTFPSLPPTTIPSLPPTTLPSLVSTSIPTLPVATPAFVSTSVATLPITTSSTLVSTTVPALPLTSTKGIHIPFPSTPAEPFSTLAPNAKRDLLPHLPFPHAYGHSHGKGRGRGRGGRTHKRSSILEMDITEAFKSALAGNLEEGVNGLGLRERGPVDQYEDALERVGVPKLDAPFSLAPPHLNTRLVSLDDSLDPGLNNGNIGLGILAETFETVLSPRRVNRQRDEIQKEETTIHPQAIQEADILNNYLIHTSYEDINNSDPPSPTFPEFHIHSPPPSPVRKPARLPSSHGIVLPGTISRRSFNKSSPRPRRVYPRPPPLVIPTMVKVPAVPKSPVPYDPASLGQGTPDLSNLPGSFVASPVLPTSFSDFGHSPLPTPTSQDRFSRMKKSGSQPPTSTYTPPPSATYAPPPSSAPCSTTPAAWSNPSSAGPSSTGFGNISSSLALLPQSPVPTSPLGTPTLASPSSFSRGAFDYTSDIDITAPSTPVPDANFSPMPSHSATAAASTAANVEPIFLDAAIASTVIGAIVCLGAVGWFAFTLMRRKTSPSKISYPKVIKGGNSFDDDGDDNWREKRDFVRSVVLPRPPLAHLPFERSPFPADALDSRFDGWVDCDEHFRGESTEDHGGYPEMVARADGLRNHQRSASRTSTSRMSMDSVSTRHHPRRRSSLRASTPCSLADSTFDRQSMVSSHTSHGISPTPPRLPSPVGRDSTESGFFCNTPDTPSRRRGTTLEAEQEPPVPDLPIDFRDLVTPSPSPSKSRVSPTRSSSKSSTKSTRSTRSPSPNVLHKKRSDISDSAAVDKARKLEKRRATVDGVIGDTGVQVQTLLFQSQLGEAPARKEVVAPIVETTGQREELFETVLDVQLPDRPLPARSGTPTPIRPAIRKSSLTKKVRPATMPHLPPAIVVSDHPQELIPPPTPVKVKTAPDPRLSVKTYDTMPWLSQSGSATSGLSSNLPRDDCSILDPDMRAQKHTSMDTFASTQKHFSLDTNRSSVYTITQAQQQPSDRYSADLDALRYVANIPFASLDARGSEDERSLTSVDASDLDTEDEQLLRNQRRRTLLYSVYQQRGVDVEPLPALPTGSGKRVPAPASESPQPTPTVTKRQSIVSSFPSPPTPTTPTFGGSQDGPSSRFSTQTLEPTDLDSALPSSLPRFSRTSFDIDMSKFPLDKIASSGSLRGLAKVEETVVGKTPSSKSDLGQIATPPRSPVPSTPTSSEGRSSPAPPRPAKSPSRQSAHFDDDDIRSILTSPPPPSSQPKQPLVRSRIPVPTVISPASPIKTRGGAVTITPPVAVRSFAADLQDSVGLPPAGYDSDTLLSHSGLPGHRSPFSGILGGLKSTNSMYSTNSASIESLEDAAIETVRIRARSSGIPQFRGSVLRGMKSGGIGYESDESTYDQDESTYDESSDADQAEWGGASYHENVRGL